MNTSRKVSFYSRNRQQIEKGLIKVGVTALIIILLIWRINCTSKPDKLPVQPTAIEEKSTKDVQINSNNNSGSGDQYNAGRDLIISNSTPKKKMAQSMPSTKNDSLQNVEPQSKVSIQGNNNVIGFSESGGTVNQFINLQPQRRLNSTDIQFLQQIPKNYSVWIMRVETEEAILFAKEILNHLKGLQYDADGFGILVVPNPPNAKFSVVLDTMSKSALIEVFTMTR